MTDILTQVVNDVLFPAIGATTALMKPVRVEMPATVGYDPETGQSVETRNSFDAVGAIVGLGFKDRTILKGVSSSCFKLLLPTAGLDIHPTNGARVHHGGQVYNVHDLLAHNGGALLAFHVKRA